MNKTMAEMLEYERGVLTRYLRALRKEDRLGFDELWGYVQRHLWAASLADSLLTVEFFLLAMLIEQHKEVRRLRGMVDERV